MSNHEEFFNRINGFKITALLFDECQETFTPEELYQAFKARLIEEMRENQECSPSVKSDKLTIFIKQKDLAMSKGLALTRTTYKDNNELFFLVEDSNGNTIPIKQTFLKLDGGQIKINIQAGDNVKVLRGELIKS